MELSWCRGVPHSINSGKKGKSHGKNGWWLGGSYPHFDNLLPHFRKPLYKPIYFSMAHQLENLRDDLSMTLSSLSRTSQHVECNGLKQQKWSSGGVREVHTGESHMKNLCNYKFAGDFWDNAIIINHWGMIGQQLSQSSQEKHLYDLQGQGSFWETLKKTSVQSPGLTLDTPGEKLVDVGNIAYCWLVASQWRRWTTHQFVTNSSSKQKGHEARFRDPPSHG